MTPVLEPNNRVGRSSYAATNYGSRQELLRSFQIFCFAVVVVVMVVTVVVVVVAVIAVVVVMVVTVVVVVLAVIAVVVSVIVVVVAIKKTHFRIGSIIIKLILF